MLRFCILVVAIFTLSADVFAAPKASKPKSVKIPSTSSELYTVTATIPAPKVRKGEKKKKAKRVTVSCYRTTPGRVMSIVRSSGERVWSSYSELIKFYKKQGNSTLQKQYATILKAAKRSCVRPPTPPASSLDPYTGPFTAEEAHILYNRFAFGLSPAELDRSLAEGLTATVNRLTTYTEDPGSEAEFNELKCDGRKATDPENEQCDPEDPNDLYSPGVRYGLYSKIWYGQNPFFDKFAFWLMDTRGAADSNVLPYCARYGLESYVRTIWAAARSGDYRWYVHTISSDHMLAQYGLDQINNIGRDPNENFARELWELLTVGTHNPLSGVPNYTDLDIAHAALALTGWSEVNDSYTTSQGRNVYLCAAGIAPQFKAIGSWPVFVGTPYQNFVSNQAELINASLNHPGTALSLADDLLKEFITPSPSAQLLSDVAALIVRNNFNLIPVLRTLMTSKALFDPANRGTLLKHPLEILVGLLKLGLPVSYWLIDNSLQQLGQTITRAPTVFGWDEEKLVSAGKVIDRRSAITRFVGWLDNDDFNFQQAFLTDLPTTIPPSLAATRKMAHLMGIRLNPAQEAALVNYLDFDYQDCNNRPECAPAPYRLVRDPFDAHPEGNHWKTRWLIALLASMSDYWVK